MATRPGIGSAVQSQQANAVQNWPNYWPQQHYGGWYPVVSNPEEYVNEVEVVEGDHDVTLVFSRNTGRSKTTVKRIVLAKSLFDSLFKKK